MWGHCMHLVPDQLAIYQDPHAGFKVSHCAAPSRRCGVAHSHPARASAPAFHSCSSRSVERPLRVTPPNLKSPSALLKRLF